MHPIATSRRIAPAKPAEVEGIIPQDVWKAKRKQDIIDAMMRYSQAGKVIPTAWIEELEVL